MPEPSAMMPSWAARMTKPRRIPEPAIAGSSGAKMPEIAEKTWLTMLSPSSSVAAEISAPEPLTSGSNFSYSFGTSVPMRTWY